MRRLAGFILFFIMAAVQPCLSGEEAFKYDPKNKRDPFRPLVDKDGVILPEARPVAAAVELNLEGIVWSKEGDSYAILGGSVVRAGDQIGDYKVKSVEKTRVILERGDEQSVINLRNEEE